MKKSSKWVTIAVIGIGGYLFYRWYQGRNLPTMTSEGLVSSTGTYGINSPAAAGALGDSPYAQSVRSLRSSSISAGGDIGAQEALQYMRDNPQLSWESQRYAILAASPSALATEARIITEEGRGQIQVSTPTYSSITKTDQANLAAAKTTGGLGSAFATQISNQKGMTAMDRQIAQNYAAKAVKSTITTSKSVRR